MSIISRLLEKRGLNKISELDDRPMPDGSPNEKQQYEAWERILSRRDKEVTVETIKEFCTSQLKQIQEQLKDINTAPKKIERLVLLQNVYDTLLKAITSPDPEKEALEKYLNGLLTKP